MPKSKRTVATNFTIKIKQEVLYRDRHCIFCGDTANLTVAHYVPRSQGGLGIPQNLVIACWDCHLKLDQSVRRKKLLLFTKLHLKSKYPDWEKINLKYQKEPK